MSFRDGSLMGISVKGHSPSEVLENEYDLLIIASSWDSRCLSITDAKKLMVKYGFILLFEKKDQVGLRKSHDKKLIEFLKNISGANFVSIFGDSIDYGNLWERIKSEIKIIYSKEQRPLKILLDISSCPRYFFLAITSFCFKYGIAKEIQFLYTEGIYPLNNNDTQYIFYEGHWTVVPVPFLEGQFEPGNKKFFIISAGFEGAKTMRVLREEDPDRISILFPEPGILPEYVTIAQNENDEIVKQFKVPDGQIIKAEAGNAIEAWKKLTIESLERDEEDVYFLCSGTKPHSLALGLRAMCLEGPTVLYNVPEQHKVLDIKPSGVYWIYKVSDLSVY